MPEVRGSRAALGHPVTALLRTPARAVAVLALMAAACGGGSPTLTTVTAGDYHFDLPASVKAGTALTLRNQSDRELHEMVVGRLPDAEQRPAAELVRLPLGELVALFEKPLAMVMLAPPGGGKPVTAVGDGTLARKGRYLVVCTIPTGADPAAYLEVPDGPGAGRPQAATGPPHLSQGMFAELRVE